DRIVAGVAAGIAERLRIDPVVIRLAFVVLAFAGGLGIVVYLLAWLIVPDTDPSADRPDGSATGVRQIVSVGLIVAGVMVLARKAGLWFSDPAAWSVGFVAFGSAILWTRTDSGRARVARLASKLPRTRTDLLSGRSKGRLAAGILLVVAGMGIFLAANTSLAALRNVAFGVMVTAIGLGLAFGPWMYELVRQLGSERRERIRSEERAEVAAHLHDSVLQSLAMIQRADSAPEMATLARAQERELRQWLYGRPDGQGQDSLSRAVDEAAARIERLHHVRVEAVTVGDLPMDDRLRSMLQACGEAMTNAARHSGADRMSVYVEVEPDAVTAYVRDTGRGFAAANVGG